MSYLDTHVSHSGDYGGQLPAPTIALIPAYNEERFIGSLVLRVRSFVDVVVVIDDGSGDQTEAIAQRAGAIVVRHQANQGKAAAVNTGLSYVRGLRPLAVIMLDGDGQHCADDIPQVLEPILSGAADVVLGTRFREVHSQIPTYRQVGQHGLTLATNLTSGVWVSDSQSGFRAFSAQALAHLHFRQGGFSIESEMQFLIRDHNLRLAEVPIKVVYAEPAKRNPVSHGMQVLNGIMQLVGQSRPLLFFSASGLLFFGAGGLLGLHIIDLYTQRHELAVGYALITVLLCVIGMLMLFAGMILHSTRGMLLDLRHSLVQTISSARQHFEPRPAVGDALAAEAPAEELAIELGK